MACLPTTTSHDLTCLPPALLRFLEDTFASVQGLEKPYVMALLCCPTLTPLSPSGAVLCPFAVCPGEFQLPFFTGLGYKSCPHPYIFLAALLRSSLRTEPGL